MGCPRADKRCNAEMFNKNQPKRRQKHRTDLHGIYVHGIIVVSDREGDASAGRAMSYGMIHALVVKAGRIESGGGLSASRPGELPGAEQRLGAPHHRARKQRRLKKDRILLLIASTPFLPLPSPSLPSPSPLRHCARRRRTLKKSHTLAGSRPAPHFEAGGDVVLTCGA